MCVCVCRYSSSLHTKYTLIFKCRLKGNCEGLGEKGGFVCLWDED